MAPETVELPVLGMTCSACAGSVEKALRRPGVTAVDVSVILSKARIEYDPALIARHDLATAVRDAGYMVPDEIPSPQLSARATAQEADDWRSRALWALALALPCIVLGMAHNAAWAHTAWARATQAVLATAVVFGPGRAFFRTAWQRARHRTTDMSTLVALGAGAAWLISATTWWRGGHELYFEAAAAIIAFVALGKWLEARARREVVATADALALLLPAFAQRQRDDNSERVAAIDLRIGDIVRVAAGDLVPVDGTVTDGAGEIDEAVLTGEARPAAKEIGSAVFAGGRVTIGQLLIRAARVGSDVAVARVAQAADAARASRAPMASLADAVARVFVPIVIGIAALTLVGWWLASDRNTAISHALAVLVIACPCALGLATPTAIAMAVSWGTSAGVTFRDGAVLERLAAVRTIAFDKTGTLTQSTPRVTTIQTRGNSTEVEILGLAAAVEEGVEHPVARALASAASERRLDLLPALEVSVEPGRGVRARVAGHVIEVAAPTAADTAWLSDVAASCAVVRRDGEAIGAIFFDDGILVEAAAIVSALRDQGLHLTVLSGDRAAVVTRVAALVGISTAMGELSPSQKGVHLGTLRANGPVAMIGDGANDALALSQADVGIAIIGGAELAVAAADVSVRRLGGVVDAYALARKTVRIMRQNLFWAFAYNVVALPIAAGLVPGLSFSPMIASLAMSFSSVFVVTNSLRLRA